MTRAPASLLAVRSLLITHLDNAPGPDDLDPGEVGIVGDPAHRGGYHCGSDRVVTNDYSVVESPRDRAGLTSDAAGLDVGQFEIRDPLGRVHTLQTFSIWCVAQCAANAADTRDIREIIYSPNGTTVKRWDRLGKRSSGDSSHRWHTHFSFFRDAIRAGRDQRPLFRRYLQSIGLLEDDMTPEEHQWLKTVHQFTQTTGWADSVRALAMLNGEPARYTLPGDKQQRNEPNKIAETLAALKAQLTLLSGRDFVDESAIARDLLAALTPEKIAAAIPPTMARQVADELARRLVAGELATPQG